MQDKKIVIVAQIFISGMMAFLMTGFFGALNMGLTRDWLSHWPLAFLTGWPVAFALSLIVSPIAFGLSWRVNRLLGQTD
ncbi:Protein of unknown function [Thalassovita litoralis]|jgi:hypothetical protein|uniref:DUF2798 domain-containing protein n=1 Tax=Thalassovita litoralis TaxID=1010611 RepID=A0A521CJ51_9RHOB|nr:DUF2798 domain-containing protein [Thalassovita litoralis]SMO58781.1 Protein of unknown function [Thalassovita litoralis]